MPDRAELERLYDEHAQAVFGFVLNLTRNDADTRDILQQVFIKLATHAGVLDDVRDVRGFLLRAARNLAIDQMRRRATRQRYHEQAVAERLPLFAPAPDADEQRFRDALGAALAELPVEQREVVYLKLWERLTFEAIAEALDIPPNTAASRYRYGLDKLRERLRPIYEEIR
jgi:RNA polymerase sigma-70 factor (ECF subfamily)